MAYKYGATDFVKWMYRKYPAIYLIRERSFTKDGEDFIELVFDLDDNYDFDELSLDRELIDKCVSFANRGNRNQYLIVYCYDDENWDELDESYQSESKRLKEYVRPEVEKAWDLLDAWFEREWGEIPYNESAKSILVTEFPITLYADTPSILDDDDELELIDGTGSVVLDLINCKAYYNVYDEDEGRDYAGTVESYSNIQEMIDKLIQPMHDGEITEDDLIRKCENLVY